MRDKVHFFNNRRFNSIADYFRLNFGGRIQKLAIDAGFTCPNRDGLKGTGGCTYCNNDAFNPSYCSPYKTVKQQIEEGIEFHRLRYSRAIGFLAYFQAYSNTYGPPVKLERLFNEALSYPGIMGLVIGTRPDCVDDRTLDLLSGLGRKAFIVIEYGIETCHNKTLEFINRGHDYRTTSEMIRKTETYGIKTGGHLIFGLPGETREDMLESVRMISALPLHSIKFHQLQIIKGTRMADDYKDNPGKYHLFGVDEYIDFLTDAVTYMNPDIIIDRIAGETSPVLSIAPAWDIRYDQVLIRFEKLLEMKDIWQGKNYHEQP